MITDEILHQRHDELRECLLGLEWRFQAEKEKQASLLRGPANNSTSCYHFTRGKIVGILDCIIILKDELRRMGLIDNEDTKMVDQDRAVAP